MDVSYPTEQHLRTHEIVFVIPVSHHHIIMWVKQVQATSNKRKLDADRMRQYAYKYILYIMARHRMQSREI